MRPNWSDYFMLLAKLVASRSTCNSRPVGCVLVKDRQIISTGYNGPPPGARHCSEIGGKGYCHRRKLGVSVAQKQDACRASHAEINAIAMAAKHGVSVANTTLYITLNPCLVCLKTMSVAGIKNIIYEYSYDMNTTDDFNSMAQKMGFNNVFQWTPKQEIIEYVKLFLNSPTSYRRLEAM